MRQVEIDPEPVLDQIDFDDIMEYVNFNFWSKKC